MIYVITFIDGSYLMISEQQAAVLQQAMNTGVKTAQIASQFIVLHQVSGIPTLEAFRRNMKHKLTQRNLRMCKRCHEIVPRMDECPCKQKPEKYLPIMDIVAQENPEIARFLTEQVNRMSLPSGRPDSSDTVTS